MRLSDCSYLLNFLNFGSSLATDYVADVTDAPVAGARETRRRARFLTGFLSLIENGARCKTSNLG